MKDYSHAIRIFLIVPFVFGFWLLAQWLLTPAGYGEHGTPADGSLAGILAQSPVHQGKEACAECHDDVFELHQKDLHFAVQCEDCHSPGQRHVAYYLDDDSGMTELDAHMPREYTLEGCLFCHRKLASRPKNFPQIDHVQHYKFLHIRDLDTPCIECHSPHEPIFLLTKFNEARVHPIIFECEQCHDTTPGRDHREIKDHPVLFQCEDCHKDIVTDFRDRTHSFMRCTTCHLFHQENETAGRIFKNGNRRFCLLCHESKTFKDPESVPLIVWAEHLEEMAEALDKDAARLADNPEACLACHLDYIHDPRIVGKGGSDNESN